MTPLQKIIRTLENPKVTARNREILTSIRKQIEENPTVFPTEKQLSIVNGQYSRYGATDDEKQAKAIQKQLKELCGL